MAPFGGYKDSGLGRGNDIDSVREYLQTESVWIHRRRRGQPIRAALMQPLNKTS